MPPTVDTSTHRVVFTSDSLALAASEIMSSVVLVAPGQFLACDVWFEGPEDWADAEPMVTVRVFSVVDGIRSQFGETPLRNASLGTTNDMVSGIVAMCRDRRVEAFEVALSRTSQGPALAGGRIVLVAGTEAQPTLLFGGAAPETSDAISEEERPHAEDPIGAVVRASGIVVDRESGRGLAGLRVEAVPAERPQGDLLALTRTDSEGRFSLSVAENDAELAGGAQAATFRVVDDSETPLLLLDTAGSVAWTLDMEDSFFRLPVAALRPLSRNAPSPRLLVRGRLFGAEGPIQARTVQAFDKRLDGLATLGDAAVTDAGGWYEVRYTLGDIGPGKHAADLVVRAFDDVEQENLIAESPERCGVPPAVRVDLVVSDERYFGRTGREIALAKVTSGLGELTLASITAEKREILACSSGAAPHDIHALVDAALLVAASPDLDEEVAFALLRRGFGPLREDFFAHNLRTVRLELSAALDDNLISQKHHRDFDAALDTWIDAGAAFALEARTGRAGLAELLTVAGVTVAGDRTFVAKKLVGHEGTIDAFWSALAVSEAVRDRLQLTFQWNTLARGHLPLIQYLESRRVESDPVDPQSLAAKEASDWITLLNTTFQGSEIGVPSDIPGQDHEEKVANFAQVLATTLASAFPMPALVARVHAHETDTEIKSFFTSNPTFEFRVARLSQLDQQNHLNLSANSKRRLLGMERLFTVVPYYEPIKVLLDLGFESASVMCSKGKKGFLDQVGPLLGTGVAEAIFQNASWVTSSATVLVSKYAPSVQQGLMNVLPNWVQPSQQQNEIPDWSFLFGTTGGCKCKHCRSVLGPAAYLVDLLELLGRYPSTESKGAGAFWSAKDVLLGATGGENPPLGRRPDIARVALDCANAETPLPYIDLVNEILEFSVAHQAAPEINWPPSPTISTTATAAELLAAPDIAYPVEHHVSWVALRDAVYPFTLPKDFWAESTRLHLGHVGVPQTEILETLTLDKSSEPYKNLLARERLGTTARGFGVLVGESLPDVTLATLWGFPSAMMEQSLVSTLQHVPDLMARAQISFEEIQELLRTRLVSGAEELEIAATDPCDVATMTIPDLSAQHLTTIHRFLRLRALTGLSITDLDRAIVAFEATDIDPVALQNISGALDLGRTLAIEPPALWTLWGAMDTFERTGPSPYRAVFLNRMVDNPDAAAFEALLDDPAPEPAENLADHVPSLLQALSVSAKDLALLLDGTALADTLALPVAALAITGDLPSLGDPPLLSIDNLSRLYRAVLLARALHLSISDFVTLRALVASSSDIFASPQATRDFVEEVEAWRAAGWTLADAQYVLRHVGPPDATTRPAAIDALLEEIRDGVDAIVDQSKTLEDPHGAKVRAALATEPVATVDAVIAILAGTSEESPTEQRSRLMNVTQFTPLFEVSFDTVLDNLCPGEPVIAEDPPVPPALASAAERFAYVARRIDWSTLASGFVVERLAGAMNVDASVARYLLQDVLRSPAADRRALDDFLPAVWQSATPPSDGHYRKTLRAALKQSLLLHALRLTAALPEGGGVGDLAWAYPTPLSGSGLHNLPTEAPTAADLDIESARSRFARFREVARLVALRDRLPGGPDALREILEQGAGLAPEAAPTLVAEQTGWDRTGLLALESHFMFETLAAKEPMFVLERAMGLAARLGASVQQTLAWLDLDAAPPNDYDTPPGEDPNALDLALAARRTVKAKYRKAEWETVARALLDPFRAAERDALTAFLVPRVYATKDALFAALLIDVEMCPCLLTSRIVEATNAVQVFVQRSLLRLEDSVLLGDDASREWEWRKAYRVWEANRKVFLYPENWIEPELRDDKTPLFKAALTQLGQGELTAESAEAAFRSYVDGLFEISRLEVRATLRDPESRTDHVLSRSRSAPYRWYYRARVQNRGWTAWEPAALDIEGDTVVLLWAERRLHAVWPVFVSKPEETQPKKGKAVLRWEVRLAWSAYSQKQWGPKKLSEDVLKVRPALTDGTKKGVPKGSFSLIPDGTPTLGVDSSPTLGLMVDVQSTKPAVNVTALLRIGTFHFDPCAGGRFVARQVTTSSGKTLTDFMDIVVEAYNQQDWVYVNAPDGTRLLRNRFPEGKKHELIVSREAKDSPSLSGYTLLGSTPGNFRIVSEGRPRLSGPRFAFDRFVYQDNRRVFFADVRLVNTIEWSAAPSNAYPGMIAQLYPASQGALQNKDALVAWAEQPTKLIPHEHTIEKYRFSPLYHPFVCDFARALATGGVDGLLGWKGDHLDSVQFRNEPIESLYNPVEACVDVFPKTEEVDFSATGAYSAYNWELFFHLPTAIATALHREQRFAEAQKWFHYVFDPTTGSTDSGPRRYWKFRPFFENHDLATIQEQLTQLSIDNMVAGEVATAVDPDSADATDITAQIEAWRNDPFDPHTIAKMRMLAYQKWVVIQYLQNLFDWADSLFRQDTMESLHEALQLYLLAASILGPRPTFVDHGGNETSKTYTDFGSSVDAFANAIESVEPLAPPAPPLPPEAFVEGVQSGGIVFHLYFCVPPNDRLLGLWDLLADRLFKLRNCMNIEGIVRDVPLFAPPLDPGLLVRAAAAGVRLDKVLSDLAAPAPLYRFRALHPRAMEYAAAVQSLGSMLLSALEKKDGEAITVIRNDYETGLLRAEVAIREDAIREAKATLEGQRRSRLVVVEREQYYRNLPYQIQEEKDQLTSMDRAATLQLASQALEAEAAVVMAVPDFTTGGAGPSSPLAGATIGGQAAGHIISAGARAYSAIAARFSHEGSKSGITASMKRRRDDWRHQAKLAKLELASLDKQIVTAEIRVAVAENELANLKLRIDQSREIATFLRTKFTSTDLYNWMWTELATEHYRAYSLAFDLAKRAERAFQLERANPALTFISFGYWDSLRKGLLSGERLLRDLRIMEAAYMAEAKRDLELTKHVSLATLDASKLTELRDTGETSFTIPEVELDADYPGHYLRRIKTVALTVPVAVPPEEGVRAELTLQNSTFRRTALLVEGNYGSSGSEDTRFVVDPRAHMGLVTSTGQADPGLFEVNLHDELLLPFEGAGAESTWHLSIPKETNAFPLHELSDVVLHLRYTAKDGGAILKSKAKQQVSTQTNNGTRTLTRIFDVKNELPDAWERFVRGEEDGSQVLGIGLTTAHTKRILGGVALKVSQITVSATFAAKYSPPAAPSTDKLTFAIVPPDMASEAKDLLFRQGEPYVAHGGLAVAVPAPSATPAVPWKLVFDGTSTGLPVGAFNDDLLRGDLFERFFVVFHYTGGAS